MKDACHRIYKMADQIREEWAEIMLDALKQNGHVYLNNDEYDRLKGELMSVLIGKVKI